MPKKETKTEFFEEEVKTSEEEISKGRAEEGDDYFFPDERVTIRASSLEEATKKLKERK